MTEFITSLLKVWKKGGKGGEEVLKHPCVFNSGGGEDLSILEIWSKFTILPSSVDINKLQTIL